jgi:hypothetical protein
MRTFQPTAPQELTARKDRKGRSDPLGPKARPVHLDPQAQQAHKGRKAVKVIRALQALRDPPARSAPREIPSLLGSPQLLGSWLSMRRLGGCS